MNHWIIFAVLAYFSIILVSKFIGNTLEFLISGNSYGSKVSPHMDDVMSSGLRHRSKLSRMHRGYMSF